MNRKKYLIVGAGWAGSTIAKLLHDNGNTVKIVEKEDYIGGHSSSFYYRDVIWEPFGAHIFHTSNEKIAQFVIDHGMNRQYEHKVLTKMILNDEEHLLSWPPQIEELKKLSNWPTIKREIDQLEKKPSGDNFEDFVISMMGPTLYEMFIKGYSIKQWGDNLRELSNNFAPKRIELRSDGYRRLFKDKYEFFHPEGASPIIENILKDIDINQEKEVDINNIEDEFKGFDHLILTCPLDGFLNKNILKWRGVKLEPTYFSNLNLNETITESYVINYPDLNIPYTRTIETKHASGQKVKASVVAYEYPGTDDKHYPYPTVGNIYEKENESLKNQISKIFSGKVSFCGRLANYQYINQDQAILQAFNLFEELHS
jgi:UDP-galactopyranose mutase